MPGPGGGLAMATCAVLPVHMGRVGQATAQAAGDTWGHVASCFDSCGQLQFKLTNAACGVECGAELGHFLTELETNLRKIEVSFTITVHRHEVGMP